MIRGYFKRRSMSGEPDEGEWELGGHYESLANLQKEMVKGDPNHIIFVTDPNVEPMRVIIGPGDELFVPEDPVKNNTLELYYYRSQPIEEDKP